MSRYVEVDTIAEQIKDTLLPLSLMLNDIVQRKISDAPSIDIVRCGECKWYGNEQKKIYECCTYWAQDGGVLVPTKADDFCSYGERKDDE